NDVHKGLLRYFDNGEKRMLVIYREEVIGEVVEIIKGMEITNPIKIYVFSPSQDPWENSFAEVKDKVELCALPQAIYNAYRKVAPAKVKS
ncbi:MAG: site-specific DNA-methyltransferase, partial [Prevotella sp.]|nr:site-specific DNA-methyltransferase [Prevotella sp.]